MIDVSISSMAGGLDSQSCSFVQDASQSSFKVRTVRLAAERFCGLNLDREDAHISTFAFDPPRSTVALLHYASLLVYLLPIATPTSPHSGTLGMPRTCVFEAFVCGSASQELLPLNQYLISAIDARVCTQDGYHSRGCHAAALLHLVPALTFV